MPGTSALRLTHCVALYLYVCQFPLIVPLVQLRLVEKSAAQLFGNSAQVVEYQVIICPLLMIHPDHWVQLCPYAKATSEKRMVIREPMILAIHFVNLVL